MDPLLLDVPERLDTERLVLQCPRPGDGAALNAAVLATLEGLRPWMPWAQTAPSGGESEAYCRRQQAKFLLREELVLLIRAQGAEGQADPILGSIGLHGIDWSVRSFEIGYWRRLGLDGQGIVTEAVAALVRLAFDRLGARRLEIRTDEDNAPSRRLAERLGFTLEGVLRANALTPAGEPRGTCIYAQVRPIEAPRPAGPAAAVSAPDSPGRPSDEAAGRR